LPSSRKRREEKEKKILERIVQLKEGCRREIQL
jgi:hypothetical protein